MGSIGSVCVYCGSHAGASPVHRTAAQRLGTLVAQSGRKLVYGGGSIGLMAAAADAALAAGGSVVGVIPRFLQRMEVAHAGLTELHLVDSMHERKQKMAALADAFVVLPGGLGTLDETIEIITWRQLGVHDKPIIVVDLAGYWRPLHDLFAAVIAGGFASRDILRLFTFVPSVEAALAALAAAPVAAAPDRTKLA